MPTAVGGRLELSPWELPADRVVELTRQLDMLNALNRSLLSRIRELEATGATREQALNEAVRDVERTEAEITRIQGSLQLSKEEAAILRMRIQTIERDDVDLLKKLIPALEKIVNPAGRSGP